MFASPEAAEASKGMVPDRLEPAEAHAADGVIDPDEQAVLGEPHEAVEDVDPELVHRPADDLRLGVVERLLEDRQPREETLELGLEQAVAPGHGLVDRALSLGQVPRSRARQRLVLAQAVADDLERQRPGAGRAELDGEWQPVEPACKSR